MVIQPEGVTLELSDLEGPPDPGNPLASAIRAAREYVVNAPAAAGDRPQDPYPLLIIRPEGIETYYRSRRAIESWGADFGYEMVRSDMDLAFPPPDPQLAQLENAAVQNARARRRELARSAPGPFRVYADGGRGGGFGDSEGPLFGGGIGGGGNEDRPGVQRYGESSPGGGASPPVADGPQLNRATGPGGPSDDPRLNENQSHGGDLNHSDETTDPRPGDASAGPSQGLDPQNHPAGTTPPDSHSAADASREGGGKVGGPGDRISIGRRSEGDGRGNLGSPYNPRSSGAGKSLATERGQNWALRKDQGPAVPLSRPIRFECHADRLILLPESENQSPIEIPLAADTARSIDDVVTAIADRADSWGIAGAGLYWKPTLVLYVSPGGVPRAADLSTLLDGSGLQLEIHQP